MDTATHLAVGIGLAGLCSPRSAGLSRYRNGSGGIHRHGCWITGSGFGYIAPIEEQFVLYSQPSGGFAFIASHYRLDLADYRNSCLDYRNV